MHIRKNLPYWNNEPSSNFAEYTWCFLTMVHYSTYATLLTMVNFFDFGELFD